MRGGILIDESGRCWSEGSRELMRRLDYRGSLAGYIVRALNLGCIHMQPNDSGIRVAISADKLGRRALAAALYVLAARAPRQIPSRFRAKIGATAFLHRLPTSARMPKTLPSDGPALPSGFLL